MKLLFDLLAAQPQGRAKFHGGSEYAKAVFKELLNTKRDEEILAIYNKYIYIDENVIKLANKYNVGLISVKNNKDIEKILNNNKIDIFYSALPYRYQYLKISPKIQFVYTIHGLRPLEMPTDKYEIKYYKNYRDILKYFYKKIFKQKYIKLIKSRFDSLFKITKNRKIIVPSLHTKYSILSNFNYLKDDQIHVLYSPEKIVIQKNRDTFNLIDIKPKSYFLLINGNRWVKNTYRLCIAFDELFSYNLLEDKIVICIGVDDNKIFKNIKNKRKFIFMDYVNDFELEYLYKNSYAFVYPTLNEGFGYPPLEAMKYGVPVLASAITSLPEIYGESLIFFNPLSINEIKARILYILDEEVRNIMSIKSKNKYMEISKKQKEMLKKLVNIILKNF